MTIAVLVVVLALVATDHVEIASLQQQREKTLREILRLFRTVAASSHESVKRPPIGAAQFLQRLIGGRRSTLRGQNHAPVRGGECDGVALRGHDVI